VEGRFPGDFYPLHTKTEGAGRPISIPSFTFTGPKQLWPNCSGCCVREASLEMVDRVYPCDHGLLLEDIFGRRKIVNAKIVELDPADLPADRLFTRLALENIAADRLLAEPAAWNKKVAEKVFGGFEFGIVTIANVAAKGAPYDFIKTALFHDHICPGVTSGYLLASYLKKELPLRSPTESYYILAVPPWCKDDALAVLLNTTRTLRRQTGQG